MPRNRSLRPRACSCVRRPDSDGPMCICLHQSRGGEYHFEKTKATFNRGNAWCTQRHLHTLQNYAHINSHQWASLGFIFHGTSINMCLINHTMSTHYHQSQMGKVQTRYIWFSHIPISWFPDFLTLRYPNILKYPHFLICWPPAGVGVWEKARPDFNLVGRLHQRRCPGGRY